MIEVVESAEVDVTLRILELDLQAMISRQIIEEFSRLPKLPLTADGIAHCEAFEASQSRTRKGLYVLHHRGQPAYVGKTDTSLASRLSDHHQKISARQHITDGDMTFQALYLDRNWSALAHEKPLIESYRATWNNNGFGPHDPGRRRDETELKDGHFDRLYPIDPHHRLQLDPGRYRLDELLAFIKDGVPFLFRFETNSAAVTAYQTRHVEVDEEETRLSHVLGKVVHRLGRGWQCTFLFGYVILYPECREYSPKAAQCWIREDGKLRRA